MTESLPPLPEPYDYYFVWSGPYGTRKFTPAPHNGREPDVTISVFTSVQMGDYAESARAPLLKRIKELEKDAQRYRWLRTRWGRLDELYEVGTMVSMRELVGDDVSMWGFNVEPETLDACIDKAMEASK